MKQLCITLIAIAMTGCAQAGSQLITSSKAGDLAGITRAIENGADIETRDKEGATPLVWACLRCNAPVAKFLISRGADCNAKDAYGRTPLFYAVVSCDIDLISTLIAKGAAVNVKEATIGMTPLHAACRRETVSTDVLQLLIKKGADVNARDNNGHTPIFYFTGPGFAIGQDKTVKGASALIDAGARVNVADKDGNTPLHLASKNGIAMLVKTLIDRGTDVNARNAHGDTALAIVRKMIIRSEGSLKGSGGAVSMGDVIMSALYKTTEETLLKAGGVE